MAGILLGISGLASSGKDTVANHLVKEFDWVKISFADPIKRTARDLFDFSDLQLWGPSAERNKPDERYPRDHSFPKHGHVCLCCGWDGGSLIRNESKAPQCYLTPRYFLQLLGTELGRHCYKNIWIEYAMRSSKLLLNNPDTYSYTAKQGCFLIPSNERKTIQGVVFADLRFKNEMSVIRKTGGKIIRVKRSSAGLSGSAGVHPSEAEQQEVPDSFFDFVVENNGSFDDLYNTLNSIYKQIKQS